MDQVIGREIILADYSLQQLQHLVYKSLGVGESISPNRKENHIQSMQSSYNNFGSYLGSMGVSPAKGSNVVASPHNSSHTTQNASYKSQSILYNTLNNKEQFELNQKLPKIMTSCSLCGLKKLGLMSYTHHPCVYAGDPAVCRKWFLSN